MKNKQVLLAARPTGAVDASHFRIVESDMPKAGEGEFIVRAHYLSLDPYMRGRMDDAKSYAAKAELAKQSTVNPDRIGAVGYCFGGAVVINMARTGADLKAVAGFHASLGLNTPAPAAGTIKAKILILNGADDPFVKREQYDTLKKELDAAKANYQVIEYPGAVHAFTNPEATALGEKFKLPLKYDAKADQESKAEAAKMFAATLKN